MPSFLSLHNTLPNRDGKRRLLIPALLTALWLGLHLSACAQVTNKINKIVIPQASRIVFSSLGVHTHANYLLFETGSYDLSSMQHEPDTYPHLKFHAHSTLPTDRAALPPDLAEFSSPGDPPLENPYGPIDGGSGKPGWLLLPLHQNGKNWVKVVAPTRFANWLAAQSPARRKQYLLLRHYTLVITWDSPPISVNR